jgi:divalent metal cation (Fe/Co/Zn/Cd) transporter
MVTGNPVFDAIGSIGIGILLVLISFFLAVKIKNLLIGQSVDQAVQSEIISFLESKPEVSSVLNLITLQLGAQIMVAVKVKMSKVETVEQLIANINRCEAELKKQNPAIQWVFFEPDVEK